MADNIFSSNITSKPENGGAIVTIDLAFREEIRSWTANENETIVIQGVQAPGRRLILMITNDGILPRVITFGTGLKSIGICTGTALKTALINFISDGTNFMEISRTLGL